MSIARSVAAACAAALLAAGPALAAPSDMSFTDVLSWGADDAVTGGSSNVTVSGTFSEAWYLSGIDFTGRASPNPDADFQAWGGTYGDDLFVNIRQGTTDLGNHRLGSGIDPLAANTPFSGTLSFDPVAVAAGESLSFRFFESVDDWTLLYDMTGALTPESSYDATWTQIRFSFLGNAPTARLSGSVPEPATLALLGLSLMGWRATRRRAR